MKPLILVIDDYQDILANLKIILTLNNFEVITSNNGKEALETLLTLKNPPEVIISDIMMPEMNGYELFSKITSNPSWNHIPFIFLSAKTAPEDVRFGKMLGIDDYITKPFKEEDLIAIIKGKLERKKNSQLISKEIFNLLSTLNISKQTENLDEDLDEIILCWVLWDDAYGPKLKEFYTTKKKLTYSIEKISFQLYNAASTIYGQEGFTKAEGILLNIDNIKKQGYIYFDSYPDESRRSGEQEYMLGVIAPKINYLDSLMLKKVFAELSDKIKNKMKGDLQKYWENISEILTNSII